MDWFIYTFNNGEFLRILFNGVVLIMGQGGYINVILLTFYASLIYVGIVSALRMTSIDFSWMFAFILVYNMLFLPKVDIVIVDRIDPAQSSVVGNVPWGLGVFASIVSQVGDTFTEWSESVNTLPDDLKYRNSGMLLGASLVEAASQFQITSPLIQANMAEFMQQCVFYDVMQGFYTIEDLKTEEDLWGFISANASVARSFVYNNQIVTCQQGAVNFDALWAAEIQAAAGIYGKRFYPRMTMNDARARLLGQLPLGYAEMTGIAQNSADLIRQNMMVNTFSRSLMQNAGRTDASASAQDLALAQAEAQRNTFYSTMGHIARKILPIFKNIFEGILYGVFPFVFLFFLTPAGGKAIIVYLQGLIWLQLWAPIYSILNLMMTLHGSVGGTAAATDVAGNTVLTLQTASGLAQVTSDTGVMAGYMAVSIPLIAYGVISGGKMALTAIYSQVGNAAQSFAQQSSAASASGNVSLGNVGAYNSGMFQHNTAPSHSSGHSTMVDGRTGATHSINEQGSFTKIDSHQLPISAGVEQGYRSGLMTQTANRVEAASSSIVDYGATSAQTYSQMQQFAGSTENSLGTGSDMTVTDANAFRKEVSTVEQLVDGFETSSVLTNQQKVGLLAAATAGAGFEMPGIASIQGKLGIQLDSDAAYKALWQEATDYSQRNNFGETYQQTVDAATRVSANESESSSNRFSEQASDQLNEQLQSRETVSASVSEAKNWQQAQSYVEEQGFKFTIDVAPVIYQAMMDSGISDSGSGSVQEILTRASLGDSTAQGIVYRFANDYAEHHGAELAGVQSPQGADSVKQWGSEQQGQISEQVSPGGRGMMSNAVNAARDAGVSTSSAVELNHQTRTEEVLSEQDEFSNVLEVKAYVIESTAKEHSDRVSQRVEEGGRGTTLAADAGSGAIRQLGGAAADITETMKDFISSDDSDKNSE